MQVEAETVSFVEGECSETSCSDSHRSVCVNDHGKYACYCDDGFFLFDGACVKSSLAVATTEGYNVPFSGHLFISDDGALDSLEEFEFPWQLGSEKGTDLNLSTAHDRVMVIGRHNDSSIYSMIQTPGGKVETEKIEVYPDSYTNPHDVVYNGSDGSHVVSMNQHDKLLVVEDKDEKEIDLAPFFDLENERPSPSRMIIAGGRIYLTMQLLDKSWHSNGGKILRIDPETYDVEAFDLPVANPYSKLVYNPRFDRNHLYLMGTGQWQQRDGGVIRIDMRDMSMDLLIRESKGKGDILNVDFVDLSVTDDGVFYLLVSDSESDFLNKILEWNTGDGSITEFESGVNGFAATPIDYAPDRDTIYYFVDEKEKTFLISYDRRKKVRQEMELKQGPAALKVWLRQ